MKDCNSKEDTTAWTLNLIEIPKPCEVPWDSMKGNARVRFCDQCSKNVYNISDMSEAQATRLLIDNEGKVCISMLKRADGTVVTDSCPLILRPVRNGYKKLVALCSAFIALGCNQMSAFAADSAKSSNGSSQANATKEKKLSEKAVNAPAPNESSCGSDTLILKHGAKGTSNKVSEPVRLGGAIAPPQVKAGSGPMGSRIELVGYGLDGLAKSSYAEEMAQQILKQWHPSTDTKKKEVVVTFWLDQAGKVAGANVTKSSENSKADKAALSAVQAAAPFKMPPTPQQRVSSFNVKFPLESQ